MDIKSLVVCISGIFLFAFSGLSFAESAQEKEFILKMDLRMKESRSQYKPVSNDDFVYELRRPLGLTHLDSNSKGRKCYQPELIIEVQGDKIIYVSKGKMRVKETPCPRLPFE